MTYIKQALTAPQLHFKQLKQIEPCRINGEINIKQTSRTIESVVTLNGREYLLSVPIFKDVIPHIERVEDELYSRRPGPLINSRIFYDELTLANSLGYRHKFTIIMQEIPKGLTLKDAVYHYSSATLHETIDTLKRRLDVIGFRHNNLHPTNIIICGDGLARPLRYHYAEWCDHADNDISALHEFIDEHAISSLSDTEASYIGNTSNNPLHHPTKHNGLISVFKCGRYGFKDHEGKQVTKFEYTWVSEFQEGRAIVAKNNKMGAIDCNGRKVIAINYNMLEFDVETGFFTGYNRDYKYLINYDGKVVHRTTMKSKTESENQEVTA